MSKLRNERSRLPARQAALVLFVLATALAACVAQTSRDHGQDRSVETFHERARELVEAEDRKCTTCHEGESEPHPSKADPDRATPGGLQGRLSCQDCHGGVEPSGAAVDPRTCPWAPARRSPETFSSSRKPERTYTKFLRESAEFVRFVNPGDLRVANVTCGQVGGCHGPDRPDQDHVFRVKKSLMTHGSMLWEAALYNNGSFPEKAARFGESYAPDGTPQTIVELPAPTPDERKSGILDALRPLPRFEVGQPSNLLRIFERGQKAPLQIGLPEPGTPGLGLDDEPGRPANRLSARGLGTLNRTDPVWLNLQRTRLLDPTLNMLGTNDHAGDYRSSGCTACHVLYSNDRDFLSEKRAKPGFDWHQQSASAHATDDARKGLGSSLQGDPRIPAGRARASRSRTSSPARSPRASASSATCTRARPSRDLPRLHVVGSRDRRALKLWPKEEVHPSRRRGATALERNPEGSTPKGEWREPEFLAKTGINGVQRALANMQLADFHGHGFFFRAVWKRDRKGHLLDDGRRDRLGRRSRPLEEGRPLEGHPPRARHALRRLPLRHRLARRRQALRRAARGDGDQVRRLPRDDRRADDARDVRATPGDRTSRPGRFGRADAFRRALPDPRAASGASRASSSSSARASSASWSGVVPQSPPTRAIRRARVTASR